MAVVVQYHMRSYNAAITFVVSKLPFKKYMMKSIFIIVDQIDVINGSRHQRLKVIQQSWAQNGFDALITHTSSFHSGLNPCHILQCYDQTYFPLLWVPLYSDNDMRVLLRLSLTVTTLGQRRLSYHWRFNGKPLHRETSLPGWQRRDSLIPGSGWDETTCHLRDDYSHMTWGYSPFGLHANDNESSHLTRRSE